MHWNPVSWFVSGRWMLCQISHERGIGSRHLKIVFTMARCSSAVFLCPTTWCRHTLCSPRWLIHWVVFRSIPSCSLGSSEVNVAASSFKQNPNGAFFFFFFLILDNTVTGIKTVHRSHGYKRGSLKCFFFFPTLFFLLYDMTPWQAEEGRHTWIRMNRPVHRQLSPLYLIWRLISGLLCVNI